MSKTATPRKATKATKTTAKSGKTAAPPVESVEPKTIAAELVADVEASAEKDKLGAPRLVRKPVAPVRAVRPSASRGAGAKRGDAGPDSTPLPAAVEDALAKARAALDELTAPRLTTPPARREGPKAPARPAPVAPTTPGASPASASVTPPASSSEAPPTAADPLSSATSPSFEPVVPSETSQSASLPAAEPLAPVTYAASESAPSSDVREESAEGLSLVSLESAAGAPLAPATFATARASEPVPSSESPEGSAAAHLTPPEPAAAEPLSAVPSADSLEPEPALPPAPVAPSPFDAPLELQLEPEMPHGDPLSPVLTSRDAEIEAPLPTRTAGPSRPESEAIAATETVDVASASVSVEAPAVPESSETLGAPDTSAAPEAIASPVAAVPPAADVAEPVAPEAAAPSAPAIPHTATSDRDGLSILMVASEAVPFAKTGGLADVVAALPLALARLGHRVTTIIPRYRGVPVSGAPVLELDIALGPHTHHVRIYEADGRDGARVWLVDEPALFDRDGIYGHDGHDHADNPRRYALLARAALDAAVAGGLAPDIIHAHDWQGGLAPVYLKTRYAHDPVLGGVPSIFTIHNIAYAGICEPRWLAELDLGWDLFRPDGGLEFFQQVSLLKAGINFSEKVTTVSPTYARELLTPQFAFGFQGVLAARRDDFVGILNGIDADAWNPATDPLIPARYTVDDLSGKAFDKRELLRAYDLPHDDAALRVPLIGMVSRMVDQKGLDLIAQAAHDLPHLGARFVILGTGEPRYEEMWRALAIQYPDRIGVKVGFDERLSHLVEAGADLFLMPSRFEPCGLNQMYSLRYGTLPFVRATGGLDDTVDNFHPATGGGNGFKFWEPSGPALVNTLRWALGVYREQPDAWRRLQRAAMAADFSWTSSARQYVDLYETVLRAAGRLRDRQGARTRLIV